MEPFWQTFLFTQVVQWTTFAVLLLLVFSPFIIISSKRLHPIKWWHILIVYIASWFIYFDLNYFLISSLTRYLSNTNSFTDIIFVLDNAYWSVYAWRFVFFPLSVFYTVKLFYGHFTFRNFLIALFFSILIFGGLMWHMFYGLSQGFGELLNYF